MLDIVAACGSMVLRDGVGTLLTVAEARGRALLAGVLDALGDLAGIAVTVFGAGAIITHGFTAHTAVLITAMCLTSLVGTTGFTTLSRRIKANGE